MCKQDFKICRRRRASRASGRRRRSQHGPWRSHFCDFKRRRDLYETFLSRHRRNGAQAASPLLFPETVFNAPASHLAAILGITGASYTLVGDGAVGVLALKMAEDLMQCDMLDYCLVVGAEEVDWLLCDAYNKWRLLRSYPPIEPFSRPPKGMILSEGAGAVLLGRKGQVVIDRISAGGDYPRQKDASTRTHSASTTPWSWRPPTWACRRSAVPISTSASPSGSKPEAETASSRTRRWWATTSNRHIVTDLNSPPRTRACEHWEFAPRSG